MLKNMKISSKVFWFVVIQFVLLALVLAIVSIVRINFITHNVIKDIFLDKLSLDLDCTHQYIREYYGKLSYRDYTIVDSEGVSIEGDISMVDAISADKNIYATIFVKQGVDFRRISTSVRNYRDERILGSLLETGNPINSAKANLMIGEKFLGQSTIYGEVYLGGYAPLLDENLEVFGAIFVGMPMETVYLKVKNEMKTTMTILILISVVLLWIFILMTNKLLNLCYLPIKNTINDLKGITESKTYLKKRLKIVQNDEIGEMSSCFNSILDELSDMILSVQKNVTSIHNKSIDMASTTLQMVKNSEKINGQASLISASTEEINSNTNKIIALTENSNHSVANVATSSENLTSLINNLAVVTEHANANVNSILDYINGFESTIEDTGNNILTLVNDIHLMTAALEKMNNTFDLVVKNSQTALDKSEIVHHEAKSATQKMNEMIDLTNNFGKTIKNINNLTDQTNILIFNMSLEAARMGENGRCFLTVISEMKSLAKESAEVMENLIDIIEKIQKGTNSSNSYINTIVKNLEEMNTAIISSINEQNFTIDEIVQSQGILSCDASNVDIKIKNLIEYAKSIIAHANQTMVVCGDISQNSYNSAKASNEITSLSAIANDRVHEISKATMELMYKAKEVLKNMSIMQTEVQNATLNAESSKKSSEELFLVTEELKKQTEMFFM